MTVSNTDVLEIYTGDGSTKAFAVPFDNRDNTDVVVILRDESDSSAITEVTQTVDIQYTLSGGPPATQVNMVTAPTATQKLIVLRDRPLTQSTDYINSNPVPAEAHEDAIDKLSHEDQELNEKVQNRSLLLNIGDRTKNLIPHLQASKFLKVKSDLSGFELVDVETGATTPVLPSGSTDRFLRLSDGATKTLEWVDPVVSPMGLRNIRLVTSGGTTKIVGDDGNDLSSSNIGWVRMPSATTPGKMVTLPLTSSPSFIDDTGASEILGERFGFTTSIAITVDVPFFGNFINTNDTGTGLKFGITRNNCMSVTPATAKQGIKGTASTDKDKDTLFIWDSATVAAGLPLLQIAGLRMRMSSSDDWTVQTLNHTNGDGIRPDPHFASEFDMPISQNGADSGNYFSASSGAGPIWTTPANIVYKWGVKPGGYIWYNFSTRNAGVVATTGNASDMFVHLPAAFDGTTTGEGIPVGVCNYAGTASDGANLIAIGGQSQARISNALQTQLDANNFVGTNDHDIIGSGIYRAFREVI